MMLGTTRMAARSADEREAPCRHASSPLPCDRDRADPARREVIGDPQPGRRARPDLRARSCDALRRISHAFDADPVTDRLACRVAGQRAPMTLTRDDRAERDTPGLWRACGRGRSRREAA
jgi:hypothetical protein